VAFGADAVGGYGLLQGFHHDFWSCKGWRQFRNVGMRCIGALKGFESIFQTL